jgi:uncharacterized surface protein with fasciclin (FAS1) repeats
MSAAQRRHLPPTIKETRPMSFTKMHRTVATVSVVAAAGLALGACSSSSKAATEPNTSTTAADTTMTTAPAAKTIVEIAASNPDFSTLVAGVKAAGLADTLSGPGPFTVFAPTNAAFAKLPAGTLDTLLKPENKQQLAAILTYHVLPATVMASDVQPGKVKTVNGATVTVTTENGTVILTDGQGNKAKVIKTDIVASNGVIHVIDAVLLPPKQ